MTELAEWPTLLDTQLVGDKYVWPSRASRDVITVEETESATWTSFFETRLRTLNRWLLASNQAILRERPVRVTYRRPVEAADLDMPEERNATLSPSAPAFETAVGTDARIGRLRDIFREVTRDDLFVAAAPITVEPSIALLRDVPVVLKETRTKAGLPVQDLAAMFGIKRRQFYNLVSGEDMPDKAREDRIFRVAEAINQIGGLVNGNSRKVRAALLARMSGDSLYNAAVADNESRLDAALRRALAAIRDGVSIRQQLPPSDRATPSEAAAVRAFRRAVQDEMGTSSDS